MRDEMYGLDHQLTIFIEKLTPGSHEGSSQIRHAFLADRDRVKGPNCPNWTSSWQNHLQPFKGDKQDIYQPLKPIKPLGPCVSCTRVASLGPQVWVYPDNYPIFSAGYTWLNYVKAPFLGSKPASSGTETGMGWVFNDFWHGHHQSLGDHHQHQPQRRQQRQRLLRRM